jgi:hypothetical protein
MILCGDKFADYTQDFGVALVAVVKAWAVYNCNIRFAYTGLNNFANGSA